MLRPIDIHKAEFKHAFRGYSVEEVDEYIDKIVAEYESVYKENTELKEKLQLLQKQVDEQAREKDTLDELLEFVKETSEQTRITAERNAERLIASAQAQAKEIIAQAKAKARQEELHYQELARKTERFRQRFRQFLEGYLADLDDPEETPYSEGQTRVFTAVREAAPTTDELYDESENQP